MEMYYEEEEWYPVFILEKDVSYWPERKIEVSDEFLARYKAAHHEFRMVQNAIREILEVAYPDKFD